MNKRISFIRICALFFIFGSGTACSMDTSSDFVCNQSLMEREKTESKADYKIIEPSVFKFAKERGFSIQDDLKNPQGNIDFAVDLVRNDMVLSLIKRKGESIVIYANKLPPCSEGDREKIQKTVHQMINELKIIVSNF